MYCSLLFGAIVDNMIKETLLVVQCIHYMIVNHKLSYYDTTWLVIWQFDLAISQ